MKFFRNLIISLVLVTSGQVFAAQALPTSITKFAFGSCAKERLPQPIWTQIGAENPDLFLFIGDNNYADWQEVNGKMTSTPVTNKSRFDEAYATLAAIPEFVEFRKNVPLLATWDDHDYGANDGGKEYPLKKYSQKAFIEFFGFEDNHPIHEQQGVYQSYIIGEEGKRVQFILLDTRYHRDAIDKNTDQSLNNTYMATSDTSRSMLGEAQWRWLEKTLKQPAEIRFIVSSIQVVAYQHGWESWGTMPHERQRLYDLIAKTNANGLMFLSGDRHLMELSKDTGRLGSSVPYPMWDFTSSGMTDKARPVKEANDFRIGPVKRQTNYGTITIDWGNASNPEKRTKVILTAKGPKQEVLYQHSVDISTLKNK